MDVDQYNPNLPPVVDPPGLQYFLEYLRDAYENPPVFIEENGKSKCTVLFIC